MRNNFLEQALLENYAGVITPPYNSKKQKSGLLYDFTIVLLYNSPLPNTLIILL